MLIRWEVAYKTFDLDSRSVSFSKRFATKLKCVDLFWIKVSGIPSGIPKDELNQAAREILLDPLLHQPTLSPLFEGQVYERRLHPGMTDNRARTLKEALGLYFKSAESLEILSGDGLILEQTQDVASDFEQKLRKAWVNPWIHTWSTFSAGAWLKHDRFLEDAVKPYFKQINPTPPPVEVIPLREMNDLALTQLSQRRLLALSLVEMKEIQGYFSNQGRDPTDVELEIIAQTWSEHCKHKIFGANVTYTGGPGPDQSAIPSQIKSLFKTTIAETTAQSPKPWLVSVFKDNAGIVAFTEQDSVCLKVETHNSPSALDPFGGAITGIVGVNRDILGTGIGAKPIFNTNVFCVGPSQFEGTLPDHMHHPKDLLEGVRLGVEEGGNQSGIPTVNGAVYFDECFMGKPLIFVGSGGILPRQIQGRDSAEKSAFVGDLIYMVGGRIGKDGIHGATFSSLELTDQMPSSVVQLGDPITQKRMTDFLLKARDQNLIQALTDNGAGGLSSSVGEICNLTGGAKIDLAMALSKYPGMAAWEQVVSESQERMTVIVRPTQQQNFEKMAQLFEVEVSLLGTLTDSGFFEITVNEKTVGKLGLHFLHEQTPKLELKASWSGKGLSRSTAIRTKITPAAQVNSTGLQPSFNAVETLRQMLRQPNIASKEAIIRQYDHEVQGCSVIKPLQTAAIGAEKADPPSSPNDAGVQRIRVDLDVSLVISCGMNPEWSLGDPYLMAQLAVDEAVRNALCVGAEYSAESPDALLALVDNFCWPDPTQDSEVMGALVRACYGLRNAALELKLPFISGKDSMKNDFRGTWDGQAVHIAVLPTLLVSALGRIQKAEHARSADFKTPGDVIYLIGPKEATLAHSEWAKTVRTKNDQGKDSAPFGSLPLPQWALAKKIYNWLGSSKSQLLRSLHDCSDGGWAVAAVECCFARNFGVHFDLTQEQAQSAEFLFGEGFHRFVGSVAAADQQQVEQEWVNLGIPFLKLGKVIADPEVRGLDAKSELLRTLFNDWKNGGKR